MFERLKGRFVKASLSAKSCIAMTLCSAFVVSTCCGFAYATPNLVTIYDAEKAPIHVKTTSASVGKILSKQGIVLNNGDKMNIALNDKIANDTIIEIYRANKVKVNYLGETKEYETTKTLVSDVLYEIGIEVDDNDSITPRLTDTVENGDEISIVVSESQKVVVQEDIPYNTQEKENSNRAAGEKVVVQEGRKGVKEFDYNVEYNNGEEVSRTLVNEIVLTEAVDEIIEVGTQSVFELGAIPASKPTNYKSVKTFQATAYDASPADNGPWAGQTSTGMKLEYGVVAVDPRVIPYGTKMYIESADGQYIYGYAIAGDCGGAIKGNRIDLFYDSRTQCNSFGRRDVNIYFLD